jgi:hypothetical protein
MSAKVLLLVALVILTLSCMELPEWAGVYNDASNDFAIAPSKPALAGVASAQSTPQPRDWYVEKSVRTSGKITSAQGTLLFHDSSLLRELINIQRK